MSDPADAQRVVPPLAVGTMIGNYLIDQVLDSEPTGNRYLAHATTSPASRYELAEYPVGEETPLLALARLRLEHPALLAPCDLLTVGDRVYVIIPAPQRAEPVGPLPVVAALQHVMLVGEALAYLHSRGVAHLRVQPASIRLVNGRACLASLEASQVVRVGGDDARLLFERDANFLALTLGVLAAQQAENDAAALGQAIATIRERGINHSYQSVAQVIADCQQVLAQVQAPASMRSQTFAPALSVQAGHATSVGLVRSHNEDALGNLVMTTLDGQGRVRLFACFVVADGMGGEACGEVASQLAVQSILEHVLRRLAIPTLQQSNDIMPDRGGGTETLERERQMREVLLDGFRVANHEIRALAHVPGQKIGTTATALLISGRQALIGHVGDSRAYRLNSGVLATLTEDHSYVRRLIQLGKIDPVDYVNHPQRNALYRALGQQDEVEVDLIACPLESGDRLLLCSDGLWDAVSERLLAQGLMDHEGGMSPAALAARFVALADEAGGQDNSTAIVIEIEGA